MDDSANSLEPDSSGPWPIGLGLFLASAVILFGAILTGYALLRVNDPGAFTLAPSLLSRKLGLFTAASLVVTCLAAAAAVRFALAGKVGLARRLLTVALLAGVAVLAERAIELPSTTRRAGFLSSPADVAPKSSRGESASGATQVRESEKHVAPGPSPDQPQMIDGELWLPHSILPAASTGPSGTVRETITLQKPGAEGHAASSVRRFFSLLLLVNGLHSIYVVFGLVFGVWLLVSTARGRNPRIPLAMAAAYWVIIGAIGILLIPAFYV